MRYQIFQTKYGYYLYDTNENRMSSHYSNNIIQAFASFEKRNSIIDPKRLKRVEKHMYKNHILIWEGDSLKNIKENYPELFI
jgi:hypothetical protein